MPRFAASAMIIMPGDAVLQRFSIRGLVPDPDLIGARRGVEGRAHPAVQARLRRKYRTFQPEAHLASVLSTAYGPVRVEGRLDGVRHTSAGVVLYEIKPVPGPARSWIGHSALRSARWQLRLYMELAQVSAQWGADVAGGVLVLVDRDGRTAEERIEVAPAGLLRRRLETVIAESKAAERWSSVSLAALAEFVQDDAKGDRSLQRAAWESLLSRRGGGNAIMLSLPPGAGKTRLAVRYALQEAVAQALPLFWITTKSRGRDEVLHELARYMHASLPMRVLWKTAARRLCQCSQEERCPKRERTLEHYFLNGTEEWRGHTGWGPKDVADYAEQHELCGYELTRQLEPLADVVIADLNYMLEASSLYDRAAVIVFDEAQNLPERIDRQSRVMLHRRELAAAIRTLPVNARKRYRALHTPEFDDEFDGSASIAQWSDLETELRLASTHNGEVVRQVARLACMFQRYGENYAAKWFHGPDGSGWAGILLQPHIAIADLLCNRGTVVALSGSLATCVSGFERFEVVTAGHEQPPPVAIVPLLDFSHPISMNDHADATEILCSVLGLYGRTVAVFGQNRASNQILAMRLQVRGYTVLLDVDVTDGDWSLAREASPDFVFLSLGGSLSEAVNPPVDLFSCGVVLAPGFRPPDIFVHLQRTAREFEEDDTQRVPESVSRVVQAAGRLQRSPQRMKPVLLVNKLFAEPNFLRTFPRDWYLRRPEELLFDSLADAQMYLNHRRHAS